MNAEKQLSSKKAWGALNERARLGEKFGFIGCLALLYKSNLLTKSQVAEQLNAGEVTREDLRKFREQSRTVLKP